MLSFAEIMLYAPLQLCILSLGIFTLVVAGITIRNQDYPFTIMFGILGTFIVLVGAVAIVGSTVTHISITPCEIIGDSDSYNYLVADEKTDTIYYAESDEVLRMRVNQTVEVDVLRDVISSHPTIVKSYGKLCDSSKSDSCEI